MVARDKKAGKSNFIKSLFGQMFLLDYVGKLKHKDDFGGTITAGECILCFLPIHQPLWILTL